MAVTSAVGPVLAIACAALLALLGGCAQPGERATEVETGLDDDAPVPSDAAQQVAALTALRDSLDEDGDGFVSPTEAEGYYRRHFELLDNNDDGRLSRAELKPEARGTPDLEIAYEELVGATEQEYVEDNLRRYKLGTDRTIGMMSTQDFDEMVGTSDPVINDPRPGVALP